MRTGARLLTLLCFFHFYGLNNGYTLSKAVSGAEPGRSLALVHHALKDVRPRSSPARVLSPLAGIRDLVFRTTERFQTSVKAGLSGAISRTPFFASFRTGAAEYSGRKGPRLERRAAETVLCQREDGFREGRDLWIGADRFERVPPGGRSLRSAGRDRPVAVNGRSGELRRGPSGPRMFARVRILKAAPSSEDDLNALPMRASNRNARHAVTGFLSSGADA